MLNNILFPLDRAEFAEQILPRITQLVSDTDAEITIVHVMQDLLRTDPEKAESVIKEAHALLDHAAARLGENVKHVRRELRMGDTVREICKLAMLLPASLIAMPTHARTGLDRVFHGSIAESVLRKSTVPMLISPARDSQATQPPDTIQRILFPLDDIDMALEIVPLVEFIAAVFDAEVFLYHDVRGSKEDAGGDETQAPEVMFAPLCERLRHNGVRVTVESSQLQPAAAEIVNKTQDLNIDLVAMVTHGRSGLERGVFGSVTEAVLRHSRCPVLTKHTDRYRKKSNSERFVTG